MDINTCFETTKAYHTIAYYSHLVPVSIALLLGLFVLFKSRFSFLSKVFFMFVLGFCLWLVGDVIIWTNSDYYLITALWAPLDYINILFYLLAAYFFSVLIKGGDIANWQKMVLFAVSLPAWWLTATGQSIVDFYQPWCEATNNDWLTQYKLIVELLVLAFIMFSAMFAFFKSDRARRRQIALVGVALVLFLAIFASTEYISSVTGIYEINLYSLFILPIFLAMIIFSITNLKIFAFRTFGTQLLIYVLLIMVGSQFFLLQDATYRVLTLVTFVLSLFLGIVLVRNVRKEEQLSLALEISNEGQAQLIHFINHQIKGYLGKARIIFSELLTEPEYGPVTAPAKEYLEKGESFVKEGVDFVQQILRASDIEKGTFTYDMKPLDIGEIVAKEAEDKKAMARDKGLKYEVEIRDGDYRTKADANQIREAIRNLIDNAINYTPKGSVKLLLARKNNNILLTIDDTGVGISDELKPKLFTKGGRDKDSLKINVNSTGFGLSIVKSIVDAHKGRVWADSAGPNRGSTFYMELPVT
ncbi:MAG: HAMP domain-containing sensor histidine kinase [Minisyncoccia bacterium]